MMGSGYEGVREIQKRLTNTMGWSATSGQVHISSWPVPHSPLAGMLWIDLCADLSTACLKRGATAVMQHVVPGP